MEIHRNTTSTFAFGNANKQGRFRCTHESTAPEGLKIEVNDSRGTARALIDKDGARQLAAILLHFADTGELDLPAEGGA